MLRPRPAATLARRRGGALVGALGLALLAALAPLCIAPAAAAGGVAPAGVRGADGAVLPPGGFLALSYHEVRDEVRNYPDPYAVDSGALVAQFAWLRGNGYTPVSLQAVIEARAGGAPLPPKAVLLTFDDAYLSFYTRAFPLLRQFNYPAVLAVVGRWIDEPGAQAQATVGGGSGGWDAIGGSAAVGEGAAVAGGMAVPGGSVAAGASFPSWAQLRELAASGLVEFASHSYDLHRGVPANPQGNLEPAATARIYDAATGAYETDQAWRTRVRADLARNSELIERHTGRRPRAIVWPYGAYSGALVQLAAELGMPVGITLDDGQNTAQVPLSAVRRRLLVHNPGLAEFAGAIAGPRLPLPVRVVEVSLDAVADPDPALQERKLSALLDRMIALSPTHVFLHAFSQAAGGIGEPYFPNRQGTMRADLFNRVAWQLATRCDVKVFAVVPAALGLAPPGPAAALVEDLARAAAIDGLYFPPAASGLDAGDGAFALALAARRWRAPLAVARGITQEQATPQVLAALGGGTQMIVLTQLRGELPAVPRRMADPGAGAPETARVVLLLDGRERPGERRAGEALAERMRAFKRAGLIDFGYREDDFLHDNPPLAQIAPALAVRETTFK